MTDRPSEEQHSERLAALEKRLAERRKAEEVVKPAADGSLRMADMAWRMVIELVSGLGIGFGIGFGLDALAGTKPWLMLVFTLLGLVAGIRVMIRSAEEMNKKAHAAAPASDAEGK